MGFCETCIVPCELAKLNDEGRYSKLLAVPEVAEGVKNLYMAIGKLGVCTDGMPEIDEIYDGEVSLRCMHEQGDMSRGNYALQELGNVFGDVEENTFVPMYFSGPFEELSEPLKYRVAHIIAEEHIPPDSHGIPDEVLANYLQEGIER